ncbi:MAG: hypothetical protein ABI633_14120 [Burkholderiales bacterium]
MSLSVNLSATRPITSQPMRTPTAEGQAFGALAKSLRAGDVDAAKTAYAAVIKNAPEGATLERGSPFAQIGKALHQGDVDAAKVAFADMVQGARGQIPPVVTLPPMPLPATSSTGGIAGGTLNEVA